VTITEQLKAKAEALRTVQQYINELQKLEPSPGLIEVNKFIEQQINNYKQLVQDLRKQHGE
jgi:mannitol-specific phosphotransferase system IIBC component